MKDFDRDAASRAVSIPARDYPPSDNDSEATGDTPPASPEDRSAKDRGRQDAAGSTTDGDPSHALSTRVAGQAGGEAPRGSPMLHLKRPILPGTVLQVFSNGRPMALVVDRVTRRVVAPSERPGLPARGSGQDGRGEKAQNALSEPVAKNPPHGRTTAAAPNPPPSGDTGPAGGRAGSKMTLPAITFAPPAESSALITEKDVAARLGLSPATLRNWRVAGRGPRFVKLSRAVRYRPADVAAWVASGERQSTSDKGGDNG